jgi:HK97 gp10 family phage protein
MRTPKINISKLLKQIDDFGEDAQRLSVAITNSTAESIVADAKIRAPVNYGQLRQSIGNTTARVGFNRSFVFANAPYSPFVEFGTGARVKVPKGFEQLASQFKGRQSGNFDTFLDSIRDWCKKKGIDEKLAYVIAVSILRKGITPQPFLIPAYLIGANTYGKKLVTALDRETKKYNAKK